MEADAPNPRRTSNWNAIGIEKSIRLVRKEAPATPLTAASGAILEDIDAGWVTGGARTESTFTAPAPAIPSPERTIDCPP